MTPSENKDTEMKAVIAEFTALRQEILFYLGERRQLLWLSVIICTAILGYATKMKDGYIASLAMFVSAGCMIMCLVGFNAPQRIGAYIRIFIESRHRGFNWEKALRESYLVRPKWRRFFFGNRFYTIIGYIVVFTSFATVSSVLTFKYAPLWFALPVSVLGMELIVTFDILLIYLPLVGMRKDWFSSFKNVYPRVFDGEPCELERLNDSEVNGNDNSS